MWDLLQHLKVHQVPSTGFGECHSFHMNLCSALVMSFQVKRTLQLVGILFFFFLYIVVCYQIIFGLWMCHMFLRIHQVTTTSLSSDIDNELTIITTFINLQYLDSSLLFITFLREHNLTGLLFSLECIKEDNWFMQWSFQVYFYLLTLCERSVVLFQCTIFFNVS